ncbi:hypothetical protein EDD80_101398 [Anseongella ginsenosidimutans]|uniref:TonB-dependent receptor plug domain-containing protein n=1 Tax=Anseongella ginsenosidimutans TaxID=496056 RepID=A0A4R3KWN5_9SPHI|nr:hypothetical protein [Anseongella ginsenosidimutans]QEC51132.1 hypothetical protein FRZ59_01380 [Anseongella ginsenosidimutans]TCS90199.1 hypothetical protein EDD80_101398 [Anseongella ginsenosidimutans]
MKKPLTLFFFAAVFTLGALAQENPQDSLFQEKLLTPYGKYFELPSEGIYTHFNKSAYMTGEGVWFKIYLLDTREKRPFDLMQNVYAELFDPQGNPVRRQVLFAEKGAASGMIHLADTLAPGIYTFRAYTNWMRNMDEGNFYTRTFRVNGGVQKSGEGPAGDEAGEAPGGFSSGARESAYDISFFPEGGHLLAGIVNTVAFKITGPSGKGAALDGLLKSGQGDTLLKLSGGKWGMNSLQLNPQPGERYYAEFFLPGENGGVQTVELPPVEEQGIGLSAQWFFPEKASILVRTNAASLPGLNGKKFYLLVHNQGKVARMLIVNWTNRPVLKIDMDKSLLLKGINHVTLFNEQFQPVADRMIFNRRKEQLGQISIDSRLEGDSLAFSLIAEDSSSEPLEADLSISFLPAQTGLANFETSIYAALLLESDIKGNIEYPAWYFEEEEDFERIKGLDHLLLTQGWRSYDWEAISKGSRPAPVHEFEQGFTIRGKVLNSISRKEMEQSQLSVFSPENGLMTVVDVDSSGAFILPNVFLMDSTRVIINATNAKGRSGFRELEAKITEPRYEKNPPPLPLRDPEAPVKNTASLILPEGSELLEGVTVTGQAIDKEASPFAGSTYFSNINDRVVVITKDNYFQYNSLRDLLMKEFNIMGNSMGRGGGAPVLIVDDMPMEDLSWLDMIHISEVEAVAVNKSGNAMLGQRGAGGSINIKTRTQQVDWGPRRELNIVNMLVKGFSAPVAYYAPKYEVPATDPAFRERAAVYWKPDAKSDFSGRSVFKVPVPSGIDSLHVRTEGISSTGVLIVDDRVIRVK